MGLTTEEWWYEKLSVQEREEVKREEKRYTYLPTLGHTLVLKEALTVVKAP